MTQTPNATDPRPDAADLPVAWGWIVALGVLSLLGGIAALVQPFLASLAVEAMAAAAFGILGAATLWMALTGQPDGARNRLFNGLLGALMLVFAVSLVLQPLAGLVSLTILVAAFLVAEGVMRLVVAWRMRDRSGWGWLAAGGAVSILLGALIFLVLPAAALGILGLFLAVDLIAGGVALIAMGLALRSAG